MKKLILLTLLVPMLGTAQTNGLTLAETRAMVLAGNPSVRESLQRVAAAEAVLRQAKSAYLPTITMTGSYGHIDASLHPDIDPTTRYSDSFKQGSAGMQANWLLFDGFARRARTLGADLGVQQSHELSEETNRLLILSATVSFRQAQLAREGVEIAERDFSFNTNLEDDARKRFEAGALPEADVHNFSIRALQAESAALQARLEYDTARAVLAELMALPDAILPESMCPAAIAFNTLTAAPQLASELEYALAHRPDYKAVKSGQLMMAQQVRVAKGDMYPKIALTGDINYADREGYANSGQHGNYDSFVGVAASWDLFTGGRKANTVKEIYAEMRALEEQQESLRLSIRSSLRRRIDEAVTAMAVYERQGKIHELSIQVRDSVEKAYKAGAASITRLNEAQTDLTRARGAYSRAYIAYQLTLNQLDIETGRVLEDL
ncbi:TolC family protein [Pontiellaceae bacterium B12227]|nr:TolC family protein [Pontiellaceae bacterium B12227]